MDGELRRYTISRIKWGLLGGAIFSTVTFCAVMNIYEEEHYRLMSMQCSHQAELEGINVDVPCHEDVIGETIQDVPSSDGFHHSVKEYGFIF